jgi:hypothetical protein
MSEHASKKRAPLSPGGVVLVVFGCGGMTIGGLWSYAGIQLLREGAAARAWVPTPCTVVTSRFAEGPSEKTSYLEFSFSYHFSGKEFVSQRYSILSPSYESRRAAARAHPVGESATCFVDPADPKQAVIDREVNFWDWLKRMAGPAWFFVLGMGVVVVALKTERGQRRPRGRQRVSPPQ